MTTLLAAHRDLVHPDRPSPLRVRPWFAVAALAVAVMAFYGRFLVWPLPAINSPFGIDVHVYWLAGTAVLEGRPLYDVPLLADLNFVYTPFASLLFAPLGLFSVESVIPLATLVHLTIMVCTVWLCWRALRYRASWRLFLLTLLAAAPALWLHPVYLTIVFGQVNLVLLMLVLIDVNRAEHSRWKGVFIGIAAGIKLTPAIFIGYLLVTRRFRAALTAALATVGTVAVGLLALPRDSAQFWLSGRFLDSGRIAPTDIPVNQSITGMLAHVIGDGQPSDALWLVVAVPVALLGMSLAVLASRRGAELLAVTVVGMTGTAVSPFSWDHHWVWFLPLMVYGAHVAVTTGRRSAWWVTGTVYALAFAWLVGVPRPGERGAEVQPQLGLHLWDAWPGVQDIFRNAYLTAFAIAAVYWWRVLRRPRPPVDQGQTAAPEDRLATIGP